ncbi:hypothetical protein BV372_07125 [Nostoc sp. T09]|uniref:hypothetical protein n=1 Tax=Nostoc sp. T09 TaxID=1932621 RepID=UPI000A38009D|nr:hypothetical protein [Nostoc sp. T09]OUL36531.1 hypothetical protein BV372_07125 [Nostoc sp. T09]
MKEGLGIIVGTLTFAVLAGIVGKIFEKPPEQIAKEKCIGLMEVAKAVNQGSLQLSITVNGRIYECKDNE